MTTSPAPQARTLIIADPIRTAITLPGDFEGDNQPTHLFVSTILTGSSYIWPNERNQRATKCAHCEKPLPKGAGLRRERGSERHYLCIVCVDRLVETGQKDILGNHGFTYDENRDMLVANRYGRGDFHWLEVMEAIQNGYFVELATVGP